MSVASVTNMRYGSLWCFWFWRCRFILAVRMLPEYDKQGGLSYKIFEPMMAGFVGHPVMILCGGKALWCDNHTCCHDTLQRQRLTIWPYFAFWISCWKGRWSEPATDDDKLCCPRCQRLSGAENGGNNCCPLAMTYVRLGRWYHNV